MEQTTEILQASEYYYYGDASEEALNNQESTNTDNTKHKTVSEETKLKMSLAKKGKKLTEEHKQNISKSRIGITQNPEVKRRMSESHKGKQTWMKGKQHTDAAKQLIGQAMKGKAKPKYKWLTPDGEIIIMAKSPVSRSHPDWTLVE